MTSGNNNKRNPAITAITAWWLSHVVVAAKALHYGCAAERDERNGFQYTAAIEWRNAAELSAATPRVADYFWRRWERVMGLPRRLAAPIGGSQPAPVVPITSASRPAIVRSIDQISFANAA